MRLWPVLALTLLARLVAAQSTDTAQKARRVTVSGVVRDSIARATLAGAVVQLVPGDSLALEARTTVSDSLGRFAFDSVAPGRYVLGFFHPMLDSLGLEAATRELRVDGRRPVRADVAIPSPARVGAAICGPRLVSRSDAVVVGFVRDARDGAPTPNALVTGEWLELAIRRGRVDSRVPHLVATTSERGWFAFCNVPSPGTILVAAHHGADSTDLIELIVPPGGLLRRELYVGGARTIVDVDTITTATRRLHVGDGRLSGTVVTAGGRPVAGAVVGIPDGPQTRTTETGEWILTGAPAGTRMLEVRALGYYPERRPVDVLDGAPPLRIALSTMRTVLDTVKVNATRLSNRQRAEFDGRRRSGAGHYLTAEDVARRQPIFTSDLFRAMPGVRFDRTNLQPTDPSPPMIMVRGAVADWCTPSIYIDGQYMSELTAGDLDAFVQPTEITGIEVYTGATAPPEFQRGRTGCGSILIWTNLDSADRPKLTKARVIAGAVVVSIGLLVSALLTRH